MKKIIERYKIKDLSKVVIEIDPNSVEAEEFTLWLRDVGFSAELGSDNENHISGDYVEDNETGNTLLNMLRDKYCPY